MGKAKRNRGKAFPNFPYERKFDAVEQEIIFARQQRLTEAFRDAMGLQGWSLGLPEDHLQLLMFHGALAGVDVNPQYPPFDPDTGRGAFIRPRRLPDEQGRYVDSVEWVLTKEDTPKDRATDARREARVHMNLVDELNLDVRDALIEMVVAKAGRAADRLADLPEDERDEPLNQARRQENP